MAQFSDDGAHIELKRALGERSGGFIARDDEGDDEDWPTPPPRSNFTWFQNNSWLTGPQTIIIVTLAVFALLMVFAMYQVMSIDIPYGVFEAEYVNAVNLAEKKAR